MGESSSLPEQGLRRVSVEICRIVAELYRDGLISAVGGNVSARVPGSDLICMTPAGQFKGGLQPEDLVAVDPSGAVVWGSGRPSSEVDMHLALLTARPTLNAVVHSHPPYTTVLGFFPEPLEPLTVIHAYLEGLPRLPFRFSQDRAFADAVVAAIGSQDALILENHGLVTVGVSIRAAATMAYLVEEAAHLSYLTRLLGGTPRLLPPDALERVRQMRRRGRSLLG